MSDVEAAVHRFFQRVWNQGEVQAAEDFLAPEFTSHNTLQVTVLGPTEYGRSVLQYGRRSRTWWHARGPSLLATGLRCGAPTGARTAVSSWAGQQPAGRSPRHGSRSSGSLTGRRWRAGSRRTCSICWISFPDRDRRSIRAVIVVLAGIEGIGRPGRPTEHGQDRSGQKRWRNTVAAGHQAEEQRAPAQAQIDEDAGRGGRAAPLRRRNPSEDRGEHGGGQ